MRILLVDDDQLSRTSIAKFLRTYLKHEVVEAQSAIEAWELFQDETFPLVVTDIRMPGMSGLELLTQIKTNSDHTDVVLITGFGELQTAIEALRAGAFDFLEKPADIDLLADIVQRSEQHQMVFLENQELKCEVENQKQEISSAHHRLHQVKSAYMEIFGMGRVGIFSEAMRDISKLAKTFHSDRDVPVLIKGETGTGKEIIARMVHFQNENELLPFITMNCSAISPTLFESELFGYESGAFTGAKRDGQIGKLELAQNGTIFLDEIGDLPLEMQPKLLRALQMKEFYRVGGQSPIKLDVRFIFATNRNLEQMIETGDFRRDLYYRINTGIVEIPDLQDRKEEILPLAELFIKEFATNKKKKFRLISHDAGKILINQHWSGNIRELKNVIERVVLLYDDIELQPQHLNFLQSTELEEKFQENSQINITLQEDQYPYQILEKDLFQQLLKRFKGNKTKLAKYLNISRNRLNRKLTN